MRLLKVAALVAGLLPFAAMAAPAQARVFDWSLTGPAASLGGITLPLSGQLTASYTSTPGVFAVDSLTVDGSAAALTAPSGGNSNLVYTHPGFATLDTLGIEFVTAAAQTIHIFSFDGPTTPPTGNAYGEIAPTGFGVGTFALAAPEPSTWAMLMLGVVGVGFGLRRKNRRALAAA